MVGGLFTSWLNSGPAGFRVRPPGWINVKFGGKRTVEVGALFQAGEPLPGQDGASRRRAGGRHRIRLSKEDAFVRDAVEGWRFHGPIAADSGERPRPVVRDSKEYIGPRPGRRQGNEGRR